ncbi:hypothetical protein [Methanobacterium formicicum]|uniref:Uncharacterized protein n=1 Tax=Methanobacterium formicicum (strain DSM 3637 / PP1) TaxID=1204725 RepID=K2QYA4_METFP|nr:hypothetical protein [Methanobacterium formicicum]EKF85268.1 hypothetical protein A994_08926 [Methanobacterium formicicum DSM 3637]
MDNGRQPKKLCFVYIGVVGLLILLGGVFGLYDWKYGVVIAVVIWIIGGAYRTYFGVPSNR